MSEALKQVFDRSHPYQWVEGDPGVLRSPLVGEHEVTIDGRGFGGGWFPHVIVWRAGVVDQDYRARPWSREAHFYRWRIEAIKREQLVIRRWRLRRFFDL